jgi:hypothetical protein
VGLIRKSLFLGTGGLVAPSSKKQRVQMQQLAALQGATPEEIRQRGGRNDTDGFLGIAPASVRNRPPARPSSGSGHNGRAGDDDLAAKVHLACGHAVVITSPRMIRWLSAPGEISYQCKTCGTSQRILSVGDNPPDRAVEPPDDTVQPAPAGSGLIADLEKLASLHASGALTDQEFQAAKTRLLNS